MKEYKFTPQQLNEINMLRDLVQRSGPLEFELSEETPGLLEEVQVISEETQDVDSEETSDEVLDFIDAIGKEVFDFMDKKLPVTNGKKDNTPDSKDTKKSTTSTLFTTTEELLFIDTLKISCENVFEALSLIYENESQSSLYTKIFKTNNVNEAIQEFVLLWNGDIAMEAPDFFDTF